MDTYVRLRARVVRLVDSESTRSFCRRHGLRPPPAGFPVLVNAAGAVIEPVLAYLQARFVVNKLSDRPQSLRGADNTHLAYVSDLLHFCGFLDAEEMPLGDVTTEALNSYIDTFQDIRVATGEICKASTARRRSSTVIGFVAWLQNEGRLRGRIEVGHLGMTRRGNQQGTGSSSKAVGGGISHLTFNILNKGEAKSLLDALGPLPSAIYESDTSCRDRLATQAALFGGLRRSEITNFRFAEVTQYRGSVREDWPLEPFFFEVVGKGNKPRIIEFPSWFVKELLLYGDIERQAAVLAGQKLYGNRPTAQQAREALKRSTTRVQTLTKALAEGATREAALLMELQALRSSSGVNVFRLKSKGSRRK